MHYMEVEVGYYKLSVFWVMQYRFLLRSYVDNTWIKSATFLFQLLRQAHSIRDCIRNYESNGEKLLTVRQEMTGVLETLSQLNSQTLSPLRLQEWSAKKLVSQTQLLDRACVSFHLSILDFIKNGLVVVIATALHANCINSDSIFTSFLFTANRSCLRWLR